MRKAIASGLLAGLATCAPQSVAAQNDALFVDAYSTEQTRGRDDLGGASVRHRLVSVDLSRLDTARAHVEQNGESSLTLNLFDDVVLSAVVDQTTPTSAGYSLSGRIDGTGLGSVTLVMNGTVVAGAVRTPAATYTIRTAGDGILAIRQIDSMSLAPEEAPPPSTTLPEPDRDPPILPPGSPRSPVNSALPPAGAEGVEDGSRIDVMVVYTAGAREDAGGVDGIRAEIDLRVAETNQAFANSGVIPRLHLVWSAEVDYTEVPRDDRNFRETNTIDHLIDPSDGYMDEVHVWRDRYAADLVHLIVDRRFTSCGEAKRLRDA